MKVRSAIMSAVIVAAVSDAASQVFAATPSFPSHRGHFGGGGFVDYAKIIGVSQATLQSDFKAGKSLVQIAATKHISESTLIAKAEAAEKTLLAAQVKSKKLTATQSQQMRKNFESRVKQMVEGKGGFPGGPRGGNFPRP